MGRGALRRSEHQQSVRIDARPTSTTTAEVETIKAQLLPAPDQDEMQRALAANCRRIAAPSAVAIDAGLALDKSSTALRRLDDGKIALLAALPQDVTHLEVITRSKSGSKRSAVIAKGVDASAFAVLGRLAPGTEVTVTPLQREGASSAEQRGVSLQLTWTPDAPPPAAVQAVVDAAVALPNARNPRELGEALKKMLQLEASWSADQYAYYWSDVGTSSRGRVLGALGLLETRFPDATVSGGSTTVTELAARARAAEQAWRAQLPGDHRAEAFPPLARASEAFVAAAWKAYADAPRDIHYGDHNHDSRYFLPGSSIAPEQLPLAVQPFYAHALAQDGLRLPLFHTPRDVEGTYPTGAPLWLRSGTRYRLEAHTIELDGRTLYVIQNRHYDDRGKLQSNYTQMITPDGESIPRPFTIV